MLTMIPCAGGRRTEGNPFGWRDIDPIERIQTAIAAGATQIVWHEPGTSWMPHGQQGAHFLPTWPHWDRFYDANLLARFRRIRTWAYVSAEAPDGAGWRAADMARADDVLLFMREAEWYKRHGIDGMVYDRGAMPPNWAFMDSMESALASLGMGFMVEAVPRQPKPNRHIPTWRWPCAMLDQFAAKNWEKLRVAEWIVPAGFVAHCIQRDAGSGGERLTEEQWAILTANGWRRGLALGPGVELSE